MMQREAVFPLAGLLLAAACGGVTAPSTATDGGAPPDGTTPVILAIRKLYLGDTDRNDVRSQNAWQQYGIDLDGKTTDRNSMDVCTLAASAGRYVQIDGLNGIDNGFGANLLPIILTTSGQDFGTKANDAISSGGAPTTVVQINRVGTKLPGSIFVGAPLGALASWDGNDVWPIDSASVIDGSASKPTLVFGDGYMNDRVWVGASTRTTALLPLMFLDGSLVQVDRVQITMTIALDGRSATQGVLSGVLPIEPYIAAMKKVAGRISTSLCQDSAFESVAHQIRERADILHDGSNMAGVPCDAISIGLGFDATIVKLGGVVTPAAPADPCR